MQRFESGKPLAYPGNARPGAGNPFSGIRTPLSPTGTPFSGVSTLVIASGTASLPPRIASRRSKLAPTDPGFHCARAQTAPPHWDPSRTEHRAVAGEFLSGTVFPASTTAEQTGITYSDGTPALTYTYNRLGQSATVGDVTGTRTFAYNATTAQLASETLPSFFGSRVLSRAYDTTTSGGSREPQRGS